MTDQKPKESTSIDLFSMFLKDLSGHLIIEDQYNLLASIENQFKVQDQEPGACRMPGRQDQVSCPHLEIICLTLSQKQMQSQ